MKAKRPAIEHRITAPVDGKEYVGHCTVEGGNPDMIRVSYGDQRPIRTHLNPGMDVEVFARSLLCELIRKSFASGPI
jgi:hypothetical protein